MTDWVLGRSASGNGRLHAVALDDSDPYPRIERAHCARGVEWELVVDPGPDADVCGNCLDVATEVAGVSGGGWMRSVDVDGPRYRERLLAVGIPPARIYDAREGDLMRCPECRDRESYVNCYDDLCHAQGQCMHDPANNVCPTCDGTGEVPQGLVEDYHALREVDA